MDDDSNSDQLPKPYCQPNLTLALYPASSLAGTLFLPLPANHPEAKKAAMRRYLYPESFDKTLMQRSEVLVQRLKYAELVNIARYWFRVDLAGHVEWGGMVALIRVLAVLSHLTNPRQDRGNTEYDWPRFAIGLPVVPGGNLRTLLWLGYRYVQAFADELRMLDKELAGASNIEEFDQLAMRVLKHAALVPGHRLLFARDRAISDEALSLWPDTTLDNAVSQAVAHLQRAVTQARRARFAEARTRLYPMRAPTRRVIAPSPNHLTTAQVLYRNFRSYVDSGSDILAALVDLLRISGHVAVQLQAYLSPWDKDLGLKQRRRPSTNLGTRREDWRRIAKPLEPLAELPDHLLDCHFEDSWHDTGLPFSLIAHHEGWLVSRVNREAALATALEWGVLPGDMDSLLVAGRCTPEGYGLFRGENHYGDSVKWSQGIFHESEFPCDEKESLIATRVRTWFAEGWKLWSAKSN